MLRLVAIVATIAASVSGAGAVDLNNPAFARTVGPTSIPIGHMEFCRRNREDCGPNASVSEAAALSEQRWYELVAANNQLNAEIVPVTDLDYYQVGELWAYPDGYGDCEDFALAKRRVLMESGWDPSTLLIAVVRQANGDGHAVLMVRTDRGDLVLDNLDSTIRIWSETPYQFIKRQSQSNAGEWVLIDDSRQVVTVASTN
jgi:predicted transglutaminase-like cysteine proteinase